MAEGTQRSKFSYPRVSNEREKRKRWVPLFLPRIYHQ
jgi:hypothetical protein